MFDTEQLAEFREKVNKEVSQVLNVGGSSKYYKKMQNGTSSEEDFDQRRMIEDYAAAYPSIPKAKIESIVFHAVVFSYLR
jgi:hypothetical protein